jgi:hypothetical protein
LRVNFPRFRHAGSIALIGRQQVCTGPTGVPTTGTRFACTTAARNVQVPGGAGRANLAQAIVTSASTTSSVLLTWKMA